MLSSRIKKAISATAVAGILATGGLVTAQSASAFAGDCGFFDTSHAVNSTCFGTVTHYVKRTDGVIINGNAASKGQTSWQFQSLNPIYLASFGYTRR